ncbi:CHAT domain-containing protein [Mycena rebaudengoi]|nr:CHAT domain-containing protein [Mycena rebaudengoi]
MAELKTGIQLHSIRVTSLTNPHNDLAGDMKMSAQLIVDENIFLQTMPVASDHDEMSWKLGLGCTIETEATRLVGYVEIGRDKVLGSVELKGSTFELELNKVNPDGPPLKFNAGFSVSELPSPGVSGSAVIGMLDEKFTSVKGQGIKQELQKMHEDSRKSRFSMDSLQLWVMHERILLCYQSNDIRAQDLNMLGDVCLHSYKASGNVDDVNQAVCAYNDTVRDDPRPVMYLANLARSLRHRFERCGHLLDINRSVMMLEAALERTLLGDLHQPSWLYDLGISLFLRFKRLGGVDDLEQAILRYKAAVNLTPDGHPDKASWLSSLGNVLLARFTQLGDLDDLNQSILKTKAAVTLTPEGHPSKPSQLNNLGISLISRFERAGALNDLNQSVLRFGDAVNLTPDGHPDKASWLKCLGNSLLCRFEQLGGLDDLHQSILRYEAAVNLTPDGHPDKPSRLNHLGNSLFRRFERLGGLDDINQAVSKMEASVTLTPDGHTSKPALLNNLGNSLLCRFEQLGALDDLNQSVLRFEDAVNLSPDGHPDKPKQLTNLGNSLLGRFERLGALDDLNQSVLRFEDAVTLTPDGHPGKPARLNNLVNSLLSRFERLGGLDDIHQSVLRIEAALTLAPEDHPDKPSLLNNLGNSLLHRFGRLGVLDDLNQSVLRMEAALTLTPDGHPATALWQCSLGNSLQHRFEQLQDPQDSVKLLLHLTSAACSETAPASIRFHAAKSWAEHAHIHKPSSVLHAYTTAIELLPELAWLGLSITDRHHQLLGAGQVVRDAASAAIAARDYKKAVEWLDQGRSIIWGQLLHLRTPVDELQESHPGLADQLMSLSTSLETAGTQRSSMADTLTLESLDSIAQQSHALVLERNQVLQQIRELHGFGRFLLSKPLSELSLAAKMGPVAILNVSTYRCDALILRPGCADEVMHVPLSDFTLADAQALAKLLASTVGPPGRNDRLFGSQEGDIAPDDRLPHILSVLWIKIVHPILDALAVTTPQNQDLGRIWWCPTGPLVFLPIHAAGLYDGDQKLGSKLCDFLISSYTPSLTALIQGFRPLSECQADLQFLAVTQPSANGQSYLPGTQEEIKCIQQHVEGKKVQLQWLDEEMATIDKVQKGMINSRWVHFACHGVQSDSPTESALLLAGSSRLTLSNIIQLNLPNADLAFLSACQTATGSQELQDESVHLTAGMLLAGYRGVIGTMWSIDDDDAPQVAGDVYAHLLETSPPDPTRAAEALHLAIQKFREQPRPKKSFLHWVSFIHFGV